MRSDDLWGSVQVLRRGSDESRRGAGASRQNADDLWGSAQVLRSGRRTVFAPAAQATEFAAPSVGAEFRRKRRTALGLTQTLPHLLWLCDPRLGRHAWGFVSHKVARLLTPWVLLAHVLTLASAGSTGRFIAALEMAGASACVLAALRPAGWPGPMVRPARTLGYFVIALTAFALGAAEGIVGSRRGRTAYWSPTSRGLGED